MIIQSIIPIMGIIPIITLAHCLKETYCYLFGDWVFIFLSCKNNNWKGKISRIFFLHVHPAMKVHNFSRGKLLRRTRFTVARGLRRSNLMVARGLRRTRFTVARGSCDRHLCHKRPPEELFHGRKRFLYSIPYPLD